MTDFKNAQEECKIVEELLSPFYDEELNEAADSFVSHHLDGCAACSEKLEEFKRMVVDINSLPREATPGRDLWPGIVEAAAGVEGLTPLAYKEPRRGFWSRPWLIAAVASALLVPGAFAGIALGLLHDEGEDAVVADAPAAPVPPVPAEGGAADFSVDIGQIVEQATRQALGAAKLAESLQGAGGQGGIPRQAANPELVRALIGVLDDPDPAVRTQAAKTLGDLDDEEAVEALINALRTDKSAEARRWEAWALGEIGYNLAVPALADALLKDSSPDVRRWSAWALGEIGAPEAVDALGRALLLDRAPEVRRWSAWALGEIGDRAAVGPLTKALKRETAGQVKRWIIWALGEVN